MKTCGQCAQSNPDDANFCHQCGTPLTAAQASLEVDDRPAAAMMDQQTLWRQFIGPHADYYLQQFKKFSVDGKPQFALSWNWPAFLFISFLWFLYRKMYLHAFVYAVGPMVSTYLTGDLTVGIIWSIMAGATANYLYFWHCKEQIGEIQKNRLQQEAAVKDAGGVQPYVIWVGVVFYVIFLAALAKMIEEGPAGSDTLPTKPAKTVRA